MNTSSDNEYAGSREERIDALDYDYANQPKETVKNCDLCNDYRFTRLTHKDRYGYPASTMACNACGLTFLSPRLTPSAYGDFYNGVYRPLVSAYHGRLIDAVTIQDEQKQYAKDVADLVASYVEPHRGKKFLDIGGSTGIVAVEFINRFGLQATVLDPAAAEIENASALGIDTISDIVENWDAENSEFPVVGMFQTIDHLLSVRGTFEKIRKALPDDGVFIVDIVDFRLAYLRNRSIEKATKIDHPYSLTEETTERYFAATGFEVVHRVYGRDYLHVLYVCRPTEPVDLPNDKEAVRRYFREIREIQSEC
ncbi:MAG: class I SAM-dependent methyltransferase [Planctomycetota bacterium]